MVRINVAFAFDENLWLQTAVVIFSLAHNARRGVRYHVYCLVDQNVHGAMRDLVRQIVRRAGRRTRIHFVEFNGNALSHQFYDDGRARFPRAAMARLFLPKLLPRVRKIIWLDSDIIVAGDLRELWRTPMVGRLIGAVRDVNIAAVEKQYPDEFAHYPEYGLRAMVDKCEYVNSGVLVMNLREMRVFGWTEQCMQRVRRETRNIWYFDQDVINSVCRGRIEYVSIRFNRMAKMGPGNYIAAYQQAGLGRADLITDYYNYTILHYAGNDKPWGGVGPYVDIWRMYAKMAGVL